MDALRRKYIEYFTNTNFTVFAPATGCVYVRRGGGYATPSHNRRCGTCCGASDQTSPMCQGASGGGALHGISEAEMQSRCAADAACVGYSRNVGGPEVWFRPLTQIDKVVAHSDWETYDERCDDWLQRTTKTGLEALQATLSASAESCLSWVHSNVDFAHTPKYRFHNRTEAAQFANLVRTHLPCLAKGYLLQTNREAVLHDTILALFQYLLARGVNRTLDPVTEVGLREWDFFRSGDFSMAGSEGLFFLRLEGGWGFTAVAMRAELQAAGLLEDVLAPLGVWTGSFANGSYLLDSPFAERQGLNSDLTRILLTDRLAYVMALDAEGDARGTRAAHFATFGRWAAKALGMNVGQGGTFKPDGMCYAHQFHYGNAYGIYLLREGARAAYFLHGTPYALPSEVVGRLGKGLWTLQVYTADFDCPRAVAGRIVSAVSTLDKFWCAPRSQIPADFTTVAR